MTPFMIPKIICFFPYFKYIIETNIKGNKNDANIVYFMSL